MSRTAVAMVAGLCLWALVQSEGLAQSTNGKEKKKNGETIAERFNKLDTNKDGKLSKEEFKKFEPKSHKAGVSRNTTSRDKFNQFDRDNDGFISLAEFRRIFETRAKK
jgi:Ca2+-binding EF-hand superfamily protein